MEFKAVIFDMDGTLIDSLEDIADSLNAVLLQNKLPQHPLEKIREWVGEGARRLVQLALPINKQEDQFIDRFLLAYQTEYRLYCTRKTVIYKGIPQVLDELASRGVEMNILSNKPQEFTSMLCDHYFSHWKFSLVIGQQQGVPKKPDPTAALEIAKKLSLPPTSILYIGDSETDIYTAKKANMPIAAVCWGFRNPSELAQLHPEYLVNKPADLLAVIFGNR